MRLLGRVLVTFLLNYYISVSISQNLLNFSLYTLKCLIIFHIFSLNLKISPLKLNFQESCMDYPKFELKMKYVLNSSLLLSFAYIISRSNYQNIPFCTRIRISLSPLAPLDLGRFQITTLYFRSLVDENLQKVLTDQITSTTTQYQQ